MTTSLIQAWWLAESDRRDRELQARLDAWQQGWDASRHAHGDAYEEGFTDGVLARKHAGIQVYKALQLEQQRWSLRGQPRSRQTFAQPHPGDKGPGPVPAW